MSGTHDQDAQALPLKSTEERLAALEQRLARLEGHVDVRLGPGPSTGDADRVASAIRRVSEQLKEALPVDRTQIQLTNGQPVEPDRSHTAIEPATGMQRAYVVLTPEERAKGFVRPVRRSYVHTACRTVTTMSVSLAETYARDPGFYSGTFCVGCRRHLPLTEFVWDGTTEKLGS